MWVLGIILNSSGRAATSPASDPFILLWPLVGLVAELRVYNGLKGGSGTLLRLSMWQYIVFLRVRFSNWGQEH